MHFEVADKGILREYLSKLNPFTSAGISVRFPDPMTLTPSQIETLNKLLHSMLGITSQPDEYLAEKELLVKYPKLFIRRFSYIHQDAKNRFENCSIQQMGNMGLQMVINQILWLKTIGSISNYTECLKLKELAKEYHRLILNTSWLSPTNIEFINYSIQKIVDEVINTKDNYLTLISLYRKYRIFYLQNILQITAIE